MKKLFSEQEIRGLLLFLPLAALAIAALLLARRIDRYDPDPEEAAGVPAVALQPFDPNEADYWALRSYGLSQSQAAALLNYRAAGKVFRIREDVANCYGIDDSLYRKLEPYIVIGEKYRHRRHPSPTWERRSSQRKVVLPDGPFAIDTAGIDFFVATGLFTPRQAEYLVRRHRTDPFRNLGEFAAYFVVGDSIAALLEPYIRFPEAEPHPIDRPVNLNRADSAELLRVSGIGPVTAGRIVAYRERLGGFVHAEQLAEVEGVLESNYEKILKQIYCDPCEIQKIDINFADAKKLERHPYFKPAAIRKITRIKQLKGGWSTAEEMVEDNIFTREEAEKAAPYLEFRPAE